MKTEFEPRVRRSQRDYSLPFKPAVVGEVARGELSCEQVQRRYGIQGRSTVLSWGYKYATHFIAFQQASCIVPEDSGVPVPPAYRANLWENHHTGAPAQRRQLGALSSKVQKAYKR
ncbi:hypothetical protein GCM10022408_08260 [Hymenobacter fastidiosus]|uniref:Transposase n=1 Tax=Hymenobacter fastidiosus TaxID=486264 RepID=A0ABP7RNH7_9BACT